MLDYFLLQRLVEMNEDGSVSKTELCPKGLDFREEDGRIVFTWTSWGKRFQNTTAGFMWELSDIEEYEHFSNL